jgi:hypothetical protein
MKKTVYTIILLLIISTAASTQTVPFPNPGHEGLNTTKLLSKDFKSKKFLDLSAWVQYRVMYNFSNIPGPGGSTFDNSEYYEFFRQRFRLATDFSFTDSVNNIKTGGYMQLEYQGGWGGSSPEYSDPRASVPVVNPYNRLQARGLRYGFVYYDYKETFSLQAGILPITDQVGRLLFDADWDFNVGGITVGGKTTKINYRAGYVRLVDGVGATGIDSISKNGNMFLADFNYTIKNDIQFGLHLYGLTAPAELGLALPKYELWPAITFDAGLKKLRLNMTLIINSGKIETTTHLGFATKAETVIKLGKTKLSLLGLFATGDDAGKIKNQFTSLHNQTGTAGFWAYLHIFTPVGPSDVNDLGLNPGNGGAGLLTFQGKFDFPLKTGKLNGQLYTGYVSAAKKRNSTTFMGAEFGGMLTYSFSRFLNLELGVAYAAMGDFYKKDADNLLEAFSRIQFTW